MWRASARVHWEDCDQPERTLFIETEERFSEEMTANPNAFLVGSLVPAMHFKERRIHLQEAVCPMLLEGLDTAMGLIRTWTGGRMRPLRIEAGRNREIVWNAARARSGLFLSGGMDSLAALRLNRLHYASSHPGAVRDCFLIHGFDIGGVIERGAKLHVFERAKKAMAPVADDARVRLIPVFTNFRHLCDERELWLNTFFGAVLAAVGHAFDVRMNLVYVAASYDLPHLAPCGSHPLLDPQYSSYSLTVRHRDVHVARLEKLRIVSEWEAAFQNFRVCLANVPDRLNCGQCEKCVRTMAGLVAIGKLQDTAAFVENDVTPEMLSRFNIRIRHREPFYQELLAPLRARGREDLARTIERMLQEP